MCVYVHIRTNYAIEKWCKVTIGPTAVLYYNTIEQGGVVCLYVYKATCDTQQYSGTMAWLSDPM